MILTDNTKTPDKMVLILTDNTKTPDKMVLILTDNTKTPDKMVLILTDNRGRTLTSLRHLPQKPILGFWNPILRNQRPNRSILES